jgi:hypothetical protein
MSAALPDGAASRRIERRRSARPGTSSGEPATAQGGSESVMRGTGELGHTRLGGGTLNKHGERSSPSALAKEGPAAAPWPWWPCLWPDGPGRAGYWA